MLFYNGGVMLFYYACAGACAGAFAIRSSSSAAKWATHLRVNMPAGRPLPSGENSTLTGVMAEQRVYEREGGDGREWGYGV